MCRRRWHEYNIMVKDAGQAMLYLAVIVPSESTELDNMLDSKDSPGDPKDKDNAAYLKRREQVRRAQR